MERDELTAALRAEFADDVVKFDEDKRPYIPPELVEHRLDQVVGPDCWTWAVTEVLWTTSDGRVMSPNIGTTEPVAWVIARGRLTLHIRDRQTFRDGEGSARVMRSKENRQLVIDPGDNLKGACSNAFKKAALRFGIGAYLRDDSVKARIQRGRLQGGGRGTPAPSGQSAPRQTAAQGSRPPQAQAPSGQAPAAPAPAAEGGGQEKTVTAKIVQNPVRPAGGGRCQVVVEDNKGNRALLVATTRATIAVLAEVRAGTTVQVRGTLQQGQSGLPELHITQIAPQAQEKQEDAPTAGGRSRRLASTR